MSSDRLSIAHLSDLHLGADVHDTGTSDKATATSFWKKRRLEMQAHNPFIFASLSTELKTAARLLGDRAGEFDFYVVTGDISTNATSTDRFHFARRYLTETVEVTNDFAAGLGLDPKRLLCIPGNHDKMFETNPSRYLSAFGDLPAPPPYVVESTARSGAGAVFFAIDSNAYGEGNIGVGTIHPATFGWLGDQLDKYATDQRLRVLLLHHHAADLNQFRRRSLGDVFKGRFTVLEESDRLLKLCRGRIDVIMHGHEHFPVAFDEPTSGAVVVSAGTTMEWQPREQGNSFDVITASDGKLVVSRFNWNGGRFERVAEQHFRRRPTGYAVEESA